MAERSCKKCFHYKACKDVASHIGYGDICYTESQCKNFISADDVVKVIRCKDCIYAEEGNVTRPVLCNKIGIYNGKYDFCSYGERRDI